MHPHLYRRQFILGPRLVDGLPEAWQQLSVAGGRWLHAHPDLAVTQRERGGLQLTLLGYAIDPHHPARDDAAVLDDLLGGAGRPADVLAASAALGGRWALIAANAEDALLFHDASGLRQVVYVRDEGGVWCASQPGLLREALDLDVDPEAAEFVESDFYRSSIEAWWPGDRTRFEGVRALLPNHVLDLDVGEVRRFWPTAPLEPRTVADAVERGGAILRGMMVGIHQRYPLSVAMTAGLDSRLQLAACRDIAKDVPFFTHLHYSLDDRHVDVVVPRRLLKRLGLTYRTVTCPSPQAFETSDDPDVVAFRERYLANATTAHLGWGSISYAMSLAIDDEHVIVKANCNETAREFYPWPPEAGDLTPETFPQAAVQLTKMGGAPFALDAFGQWAAGAFEPAEANGYRVLDLFYCEQRVGRWQAPDQLERDMDHETFVPFNSREYFDVVLGVPIEHRRSPGHLFREMARSMWPETLAVPINPVPFKRRIRRAARRALVATGTLDAVKRLVRGSA